MKTISILGSGWLGLPLAQLFFQQGFRVKASTRAVGKMAEIESSGAKAFIVDIDQDNDISAFLDADILVVNITSKSIESFKHLIQKVEGSSISCVLFVSSTSVYQNTNKVVMETDGAENEMSPLFQIENLFRINAHFETTIIRFAGLFDSRRHPGRFFVNKPIPQPKAAVNLIHLEDCLNIIDRIVVQGVWNEVFNACADTHPSKREFYCYAGSLLGLPEPAVGDSVQTDFKIISNEKIKRSLSYEFTHGDLMGWSGL